MNDTKCPFCGEPAARTSARGTYFICGTTVSYDGSGDISTGHNCDLITRSRLLAEKDKEIERLGATESLYEELRSIIDGGSESMTHEDAVQELRDRDEEREQLRAFAKHIYYDRYSVPSWAHDAAAQLLKLPSLSHGCEEESSNE